MVLLGLVFGVSCVYLWFLVFVLVVVGLFCLYHNQVIGWKDSSPKWTNLDHHKGCNCDVIKDGRNLDQNTLLCVEWDVKLY